MFIVKRPLKVCLWLIVWFLCGHSLGTSEHPNHNHIAKHLLDFRIDLVIRLETDMIAYLHGQKQKNSLMSRVDNN